MRRTGLSLAGVLALASGSVAQVVVPNAYSGVVGNGSFLGPLANAARTYQMLIHADQLAGVLGSDLTGLTFRIPASATAAYPAADATFSTYDIRISAGVDPAARSLTFANNVVGHQELVRSGPLVIPAGSFTNGGSPNAFGGVITFSTPYTYTGGNLLVEIRHSGSNSTSQSADAATTAAPGYLSQFAAAWTGSLTGTSGSAGNFCIAELTNAPASAVGACCLTTGAFNCVTTSQAACTNMGGTYSGDNVTCAAANCAALPTGGCCFADGSCQVLTQFACAGLSGTYAGAGTDCITANCPQPGACCMPNFTCTVIQASACTTAGGTFLGQSTVCSSCPAPLPGTVALVVADSVANINDAQAKIFATGLFPAVVIRNATSPAPTPTLADLQQFDAVLIWTNQSFSSGAAMGDVMADYIDAGGGVVNCHFAISSTTANRFLAGRWDSTYQILVQGGGSTTGGSHSLGTILVPGHPILDGVNSFHGGTTSGRPTSTTLNAHGQLVAQWTDGKMLISTSNTRAKRVDLGFVPYSTTASTVGWNAATDGARIMANALLYAGGLIPSGCYANCDGSTGTPLLTANDFQCFLNKFAANDTYANCDGSTGTPALTANDFQCFLNKFAAGCS